MPFTFERAEALAPATTTFILEEGLRAHRHGVSVCVYSGIILPLPHGPYFSCSFCQWNV